MADLSGAYLARAYLAGADLTEADLARANLAMADLSGAYLARANLAGANLARANLAMADLSGANLAGANLTEANLTEANLTEANVSQVRGRRLYSVGPVGSRNGLLVYDVDGDTAFAGCWKGSLAALLERVESVYPDGSKYRDQYRDAISWLMTRIQQEEQWQSAPRAGTSTDVLPRLSLAFRRAWGLRWSKVSTDAGPVFYFGRLHRPGLSLDVWR